MSIFEKSRLYQAVLEDLRARRTEVGEGYQTEEERTELARLETEVSMAYKDLEIVWLEQAFAL